MKKISILLLSVFLFVVSAILIYSMDGVTVTLNAPTGGAWINSNPVTLNFTPGGNTSDVAGYNCTLFGTFNGSGGVYRSYGIGDSVTGDYNLTNIPTGVTQNFSIVLKDNSSGYIWNVGCTNNLTGKYQESNFSFGTNATFKLDTVVPSIPDITFPLNGSVIGTLLPFVNWTNSTELNFQEYRIEFANDTDFEGVDIINTQIITDQSKNRTQITSALPNINKLYYMRVMAKDLAGNVNFEYINVTVVIDAPSISIFRFENNTFQSTNKPVFNITATHQFIDSCQFYLTNLTNSSETGFVPGETLWIANGTNNSRINGSVSFVPSAMRDGVYRFAFRCNNTGGNMSDFTANRTITIDTVRPTDFNCTAPTNNTKTINHQPDFNINVTADGVDTNYGNFTFTLDNNSDFSSPEVIQNISGNLFTYTADLRSYNRSDRTWYLLVNATDKAGNSYTSKNCNVTAPWTFRTDITNHYLKNGWNIISIMGSGTINASDLGIGLGVSFSTISRYNSSKQFKNYNNGTSTNGDMTFKKGDVVFINVNDDTYWRNQTWDTSSAYANGDLFNLTNTSSGWNLLGVQNQSGWKIGRIEIGIMKSNRILNYTGAATLGNQYNGSYYYELIVSNNLPANDSIQSMVYFNNTAINTKKFVGHPFNYSFNNETVLDYGEAIWIQINRSTNATPFMIVNLSKIGDGP